MDSEQQPPAYSSAPPAHGAPPPTNGGVSYSEDKKQAPAEHGEDLAPQGPVASSSSHPPGDLSIHGGGLPTLMHVYRDKMSGFSRDDVVKAHDKFTVLYFLDFPIKWSGKWDVTLHRESRTGPRVASITKCWSSNTLTVAMSNGGHTWVLRKPRVFSNRFEATASDGSLIQWKPNGNFVNHMDWTLTKRLPNGQKQVLAEWDNANWALTKDGKLSINSLFAQGDDVDWIVATALCIEEWQSEQK